MHEDAKKVIKESIHKALVTLKPLKNETEVLFFYKKYKNGGFRGRPTERPKFSNFNFNLESNCWGNINREIQSVFEKHYPDYVKGFGTSLTGMNSTNFDQVLNRLIMEFWNRNSNFSPSERQIDSLVEEFSEFIDRPTIRMVFVVPLLNLRFDPLLGKALLANGITLRSLTNKEITKFFSSPLGGESFIFETKQVYTSALVGEFDEPKLFQNSKGAKSLFEKVQKDIDKILINMRAFKKGVIGYKNILVFSKTFCPLYFRQWSFLHESIQVGGGYWIEKKELKQFKKFMKITSGNLHLSLEMACSRLSDAEKRVKPQDKIVDAVIGLEAILLEKIKGELTYRFSENYASIFENNERLVKFRDAKQIYGLRSDIVHGEYIPDKVKIFGKEMNLSEVADMACEMLRSAINKFLPYRLNPPYAIDKDYWLKANWNIEK